ncbi:MAG: neutral zinc metallopeptidase [Planctomycetota bacterium]
MKWKGRRESENVVDAGSGERAPVKKGFIGGGIGFLIFSVVFVLMGGNPLTLLGLMPSAVGPGAGVQAGGTAANTPEEEEMLSFIRVVIADTEDVWNELFARMGREYPEPTLIRFRGRVASACGLQSAAVGPFYCPGDSQVYIDISFFNELAQRYGAKGDFAQVYVLAHEVGHHVQNVLGISDEVQGKMRRVPKRDRNRLLVRQELHADFLAGVFAHHLQRTKKVLELGDVREAMNAAASIGDDVLQRQAQGYVRPDAFTHGTAEQRQRWFELGFDTGDVATGLQAYELPYEQL